MPKRYIFAPVAALVATFALAQTSGPVAKSENERRTAIFMRGIEAVFEAAWRAAEKCDSAPIRVTYPYLNMRYAEGKAPQEETREALITVTAWTGECKDGLRDGKGELSLRIEKNEAADAVSLAEYREEGRLVKGRMIGLWCNRGHRFVYNHKELDVSGNVGTCKLSTGIFDLKASTGAYRKLADGRWQLWLGRGPAEPPSYLSAGALEAQSEKMIAAALAGKTDLRAELTLESRGLDDLVKGSKILLAPEPGPLSLRGKRVAIVLSNSMLNEIERFKAARKKLLDATLGMSGDAAKIRARFLTASDPDRMLAGAVKMVQQHAGEVQAADSLAGMRAAGIDFALVLDWKSVTRLDLLGQYDAFPSGTLVGPGIPALVGESLSGYLITPELKAVRQYSAAPMGMPKSKEGSGTYGSGDSGYLFRLALYFEEAWGKAADAPGSTFGALRSQLGR